MKTTLVSILFFLIFSKIFSQPLIQNFTAIGSMLIDVVQFNEDTFVSISDNTLIRSGDKGISWNVVYSFPVGQGVSHLFERNDTIYAFGKMIYRSVDGGLSWSPINRPPGQTNIAKIVAMPNLKFWIVTEFQNNQNATIWETNADFLNFTNKINFNGAINDVSNFSSDTVYLTSISQSAEFDILRSYNSGSTWQNAGIDISAYSPSFVNYTSFLHCEDANNCNLFINYYMNHVFYTTNGFSSIAFDTLLMSSQISGYFTCHQDDYILHTAVDGAAGYIYRVKRKLNGKLDFIEKTYLNLYINGFNFNDNQLVAVGSDLKGIVLNGLCSEPSKIKDHEAKANIRIKKLDTKYLFCMDGDEFFSEAYVFNEFGQLISVFKSTPCIEFNTQDRSPGLYLLKYKNGNGYYSVYKFGVNK
jgi:hypothetical protein